MQLPLSVIEGADIPSLEPSGDAVEVERVIADTPSGVAVLVGSGDLVRLTVDAKIHDVVPADRAIVNDDIPSPQSDCVPLLYFESDFAVVLVLSLDYFLSRGIDVHSVSHLVDARGR